MKKKLVITIGREFCSGGSDIGKQIAAHFGIPYYDKEIIDATAEVLKCSPSVVEQYDEKPVRLWGLYGYQYGTSLYAGDPSLILPPGIKIAAAQFHAVAKFAESSSCVIVGRCADYLLKDKPDVIKIFVRADTDSRVKRVMRLYKLNEKDAKKLIKKTDKVRIDYYGIHTQQKWGDAKNYDLLINTAAIGISGAAEVIIKYIELKDIYNKTVSD
ncbi:MAG: cytidylate kinase-like family protein [Clostridia bacterium]|nr:cytidylate kinase-like family protein [Clostridia bacterium]